MQLLKNLSNLCSDYSVASGITVIRTIFTIICMVVPIILIIMVIFSLIKMIMNPDQKQSFKKIAFQVLAAIAVFFLPNLVDMGTALLPNDRFSLIACWNKAAVASGKIKETTYKTPDLASKGGSLLNDLYALSVYSITSTNQSNGNSSSSSGTTTNGTTKSKYGVEVPVIAGNSKGAIIANAALQYVGGKYVSGGGHAGEKTMEEAFLRSGGVDCSGFVRLIFEQYGGQNFGGNMIDTSFRPLGTEVGVEMAQAGDIVCYNGHVAICIGNGRIVHASNSSAYPKGGIKITDTMSYTTIVTIRRIV